MKLLTFLGRGKYSSTTYYWNELEHTTSFAPAASWHFLHPDQIIVFLTEDARQDVYSEFLKSFPADVNVQPVAVPLGSDTQELWQIFDQVSSSVQPGDEVAFDITHGLRSFPLVGLLAAAFLRSGLDVHLRAVLYGAYDVGQAVSPGRTPMFDLSPMLAMLEWSAAADRFNRTGDARDLASLVNDQRKNLASTAGKDHQLLDQVGAIGSLANGLRDISQALHLIRPTQTLELTHDLPRRVKNARPALQRARAARPFEMLLDRVEQRFSPLGQADPLAEENLPATLDKQRCMIRQYADWELWVQAITLSREWLISWYMLGLGYDDIVDKNYRQEVEERVNSESYLVRTAQQNKKALPALGLMNLPEGLAALTLWSTIADVRNDIDHAGMRKHCREPKDLIPQVEYIIQQIEKLPLPGLPT